MNECCPKKAMNATHQLYTMLVSTNPTVIKEMEQIALTLPDDEAQARFQPFCAYVEHVDYARLCRLLRKDLSGCDLREEDFHGMPLAGFRLARADLRHANLAEADLSEADLCEANLTGANLTRGTLQAACLQRAVCREVKAVGIDLSHALLEASDWTEAEMSGARLVAANAARATFRDAMLPFADLSRAQLREADFASAHCRHCTFDFADFQHATLTNACLWSSRLHEVQLASANLRGCSCVGATFGEHLRLDAETQIDVNNHLLIGMALLNKARTVEQQQLALYVQFQTDVCWTGFLRLLLRQNTDLVVWAKTVLFEIHSLRPTVLQLERRYLQWLQKHRYALDLSQVPSSLHDLLLTEIEQHPSLASVQLSWYLQGVVSAAGHFLQLDEEQKQRLLTQLTCLGASAAEEGA